MDLSSCSLDTNQEPVLTDDQHRACERLFALARVRSTTTEAELPIGVLRHWSVSLLVGPTGVGKTHVCQEVARRWDGKQCRRWEVGAWVLLTNRSSNTTLDQIHAFIAAHTAGCVVYLAGVDALATTIDHSTGYYQAVVSEIAQLLDQASARPAPRFSGRDGNVIYANVLLVVGGCFAPLWGDAAVGGPSGKEAWRLADREPLIDPAAVGKWLLEHSTLPADILRRLSSEPMVLHPIDRPQADRLALRLHDDLPPSLDGLSTADFSAALQSSYGWRAVAEMIERAWVDGHEHLFALGTSGTALPPPQPLPEWHLQAKPPANLRPIRLGERLRIAWSLSRLERKTRRLGLRTPWDFEWLAVARGYLFPGESLGTAVGVPVSRKEFSDLELTAALLSPSLEWNEQAVCRGALTLAAQLAFVDPKRIVHEALRARGEAVVRHIAWLGREIDPESPRWRDLLLLLPAASETPAFAPGIMPDEAIRRVLSAVQP